MKSHQQQHYTSSSSSSLNMMMMIVLSVLVVVYQIDVCYSQNVDSDSKCFTDIITSDIDQSQTLTRSEYVSFRREYCNLTTVMLMINTTNYNMTLSESDSFDALSCLCRYEVNADSNCCSGPDAVVQVNGIRDVVNDVDNIPSTIVERLESVCIVVGATCSSGDTEINMIPSDPPSSDSTPLVSDVPSVSAAIVSDMPSDNQFGSMIPTPSVPVLLSSPVPSVLSSDDEPTVPTTTSDRGDDTASGINDNESTSSGAASVTMSTNMYTIYQYCFIANPTIITLALTILTFIAL
jgi:hypothetical protein